MATLDPPSAALEAWQRATLAPAEQVLLTAMADVSADGRFAPRWLVMTNLRVLVLEEESPHPTPLHAEEPRESLRPTPLEREVAPAQLRVRPRPPNGAAIARDDTVRALAVLIELRMADLAKATTEPLVGGGRLEVEVRLATADGAVQRAVELVTYTTMQSAKFQEVARGIQQLLEGKRLEVSTDLPRQVCQRCGRMLPEKNGVCPACVRRAATLLRVIGYLRPYKARTAALIGVTLLHTAGNLVPPWITKTVIDGILTPQRDFHLLPWLVGALVALGVAGAGLQAVQGTLAVQLGSSVIARMRADVYSALERLSLRFHQQRETGSLIALVTYEADRLHYFLMDGLPFLVTNLLMLGGILAVLVSMDWRLAVLVILPAPIVVAGSGRFVRLMRRLWTREGVRWEAMTEHVAESVGGIKVVKAFRQEDAEIGRFGDKNQAMVEATNAVEGTWNRYYAAMEFFTGSGQYITWLIGGYFVFHGQMTLGSLIAFIAYQWLLYGPLQWFNQVYNWMSRALAGAQRIFEVLDTETEPYGAAKATSLPAIEGRVEFRDVTFGYDKSKPVLKDVGFSVEPGEMIGLIGKSGAGKSTMINLICRFYEADHGTVLIDGHDIRRVRLEDLRDQIGVVLQEPFLFDGPISGNIRYGKPDATFEEVMAAAQAANAHDFIIAKPDGYDTRVGEKGKHLSVGEKQRISIARAILRDPRILILDEATASVDTETEKAIQEAIARLVRGRTTFAIAHRLSTLRNADRLLVLEEGRLVEEGTHDELLAQRGVYWKLVQLQREVTKLRGAVEV